MSKRAPLLFLLLTVVIALSGLGIHGLADPALKEAPAMPDALILTASDLHYIAPSLTDHGAYFQDLIANSDGKVMDYIEEITDSFLAEVLAQRPDALILSGDLTFNGARASHEALAKKLEAVTEAGIPVLVIPGNHDLERRDAAAFRGNSFTRVDSVTPEQFGEIYGACGYDGALSRDRASLSYAYEIKPGLRALMLDVNMPDAVNRVKSETLTWLEAQLREAAAVGAAVIAVSHQNLLQHNRLIVDNYRIENADEVLALYERYGVIANLTGHLHCQHIARTESGFQDIATSSLAVSPHQYGVVTLTPDSGRYVAVKTDVTAWAKTQGLTDPVLLDFSAYSRDFFRHSGQDNSPDRFAGEDDGEALAAFIADVNEAYFAGRMDTVDLSDPMFDRLLALGGFMGAYLDSTRDDGPVDMTQAILY